MTIMLTILLILTAGSALAQHEDVVHLSPAEQAEFGLVVSTAGPGVITKEITLTGEIQPNDDYLAHLAPRYEGIVTEVMAHEGDQVVKGQVLAKIESNETLTSYPVQTLIDGTIIGKHITLGESASPDRHLFVIAERLSARSGPDQARQVGPGGVRC